MARGAQLAQLISDLRDETRRANAPVSGPDDSATLRRVINHVYQVLYQEHDWSFLKHRFPAITLNAGQRYYDLPAGLNPERVLKVQIKWSSSYLILERGISFEEYDAYDPEDNERTAPALKWDVTFTGETEQIEIWPLPDSSSQSLRFEGIYDCPPLVNDTDVCLLDSELVVLFAAAELLKAQEAEDADDKKQAAQSLLQKLKIRSASASGARYRSGLGETSNNRVHPRAVVRISG